MCTLGEVENALQVLACGYLKKAVKPSQQEFERAYASKEGQEVLRDKVILLHCTTEYPAPLEEVNLKAMDTVGKAFGLPVGYSDHTKGISIPIAAAARGAILIEKHFTLDKNLPGPDHNASLNPDELKTMIRAIREVEVALGSGSKFPSKSEFKNRAIARKSLVALTKIKQGEQFTSQNLGIKRPGDGISPANYWDFIGKQASKDYEIDEKL